ncbi:hypothetical protein JL722_13262 [Aureococcus anophagefferens]|nr:hypothetical protein JL722_13262 [Aureococcus anophagefferens]
MAQPLVTGHNVSFVAVARFVDRTVVAWCSHGANVDLAGVRTVLDPASMQHIERDKHYNFASAGVAWHLTSDGDTWIYVAITATDYPLRHASGLLGELKGAFAPKATKGLNTRLAGGLNGDLQPKFSRLCARYDDLTQAIDQKADELQSQAGMFKSKAKKLRSQMWWKKCKMQLLITFLVLTIIGVIVIIIMAYTGAFKDKDKKKDK